MVRGEARMADKLMIVMMNADPTNGWEIGPAFMQASVAAAMEYEVEIILTGQTGQVAKTGVAEKLRVSERSDKTVYDYIKEAHAAGVRIKVCAPTLEEWGDDIIPEIDETVGSTYIISEAMDGDTVTFTY